MTIINPVGRTRRRTLEPAIGPQLVLTGALAAVVIAAPCSATPCQRRPAAEPSALLFLVLAAAVSAFAWTRPARTGISPTGTWPASSPLSALSSGRRSSPSRWCVWWPASAPRTDATQFSRIAVRKLEGADATLRTDVTRPGPSGSRMLRCRTGIQMEWPHCACCLAAPRAAVLACKRQRRPSLRARQRERRRFRQMAGRCRWSAVAILGLLAQPAVAATEAGTSTVTPVLRLRHSGRLHPVRADAARRRGVPPPHAAGRAHRARRDRRSTSSPSPASSSAPASTGLALHMQHEWVILANLFLLLMGFALLSRHFEKSRIPDEMPAFLPDGWKGGVRAARHRVRAVELPRQHRGRADRRHDGAPRLPRQSPHRLPRRRSSPRPTPAAPAASSATPRPR